METRKTAVSSEKKNSRLNESTNETDSRSKPLFDLNEPPAEEEDGNNTVQCFQPQKAVPSSNPPTPNLFPPPEGYLGMQNNRAFTHASSGSGFQPFVLLKDPQNLKNSSIHRSEDCMSDLAAIPVTKNNSIENNVAMLFQSGNQDAETAEREEGEWSDVGDNADAFGRNATTKKELDVDAAKYKGESDENQLDFARNSNHTDCNLLGSAQKEVGEASIEARNAALFSQENSRSSDSNSKRHVSVDNMGETLPVVRFKEIRGIEGSYASRIAANLGKRPKLDEHKEAMLGKKRARQTLLIDLEDTKQVGHMKGSTPRRQTSFPSPFITRTMKDTSHVSSQAISAVERAPERLIQTITKDQKQSDINSEGSIVEMNERTTETNGEINSGPQVRQKMMNNNEPPSEVYPPPIARQGSWKQSTDYRQFKNTPILPRRPVNQYPEDAKLGNKKHHTTKKHSMNNLLYQDTSVERLLREVTNDNFWHHPEETQLQCVPGSFESIDEYVKVFEPLLFEECRAQLNSTWEELTEMGSRDAHIMVRVKTVERRERGWYDVIVHAIHECKWTFKEGEVAVLSTPRPGAAVKPNKRSNSACANEADMEPEVTGWAAGTVRRYIPVDTRDPPGAVLHFYVGDSFDSTSKLDDDHVLRKFQSKSVWYLTVLGTLATTQREYIALHAFRRFGPQMQAAILKPSPEQFPKYAEQPPAMPECFTPNFVDLLHRNFNGPQLAAIQWAAMHTAAGTSGAATKRQEPWPFTLVQGPPGTGKTHTVWGMLNVIHLVQYQHYYAALLKKLAPESYKQASESSSESVCTGSIDEVLQNMDQSLFRTLPKLCPKPRMLVCAPSNAATDELLARVLDRGFIDGEMKVYRPDVARVGVESHTRAAQAVSVERRTDQLLLKGRDEVIGWMHQLKARESQYSQQISLLQRELNVAAAAGRSQGSVGVDPDVLSARDHNRDLLLQNLAAAVEGRDKVLVEMSRLVILENRFRAGSGFNMEDARGSLEASFANEAEIVFTTLSSSGRKIFSRLTHGFDMVVIDEAAQASELALLPPLSLGAARCVLVGDPQQLPATVISKAAGSLLYSRSLFERFQQAGCPTMLLSVQYRMHPQIRDFPSRHFYQGRLTDSESVTNLPDEIYYRDPLLPPYAFYDIVHGRESHRGGSVSYQNVHEAQFALRLYEHLQKIVKSSGGRKVSVGIITPYKLQLKCLHREFGEVLKTEEGKDIYINTVDAFQGQERDVIIMSCVRASTHGVGFVADIRRMNVALTRARRALWVVGNANALMQSDDWAALIKDAKLRKCFRDKDSIPKELFAPKGSSNFVPGQNSSRPNSRSMVPRPKY